MFHGRMLIARLLLAYGLNAWVRFAGVVCLYLGGQNAWPRSAGVVCLGFRSQNACIRFAGAIEVEKVAFHWFL